MEKTEEVEDILTKSGYTYIFPVDDISHSNTDNLIEKLHIESRDESATSTSDISLTNNCEKELQVEKLIGEETAQLIRTTPITSSEFNGVVQSLDSHPHIIRKVIPSALWSLQPEDKDTLITNISQILQDANFLESTARILDYETNKAETKTADVQKTPFVHIELGGWDVLQRKFPCILCHDVLAAPVLLNCTHSYCYICIQDYLSNPVTDDTETIACCPQCHTVITATTFESSYDEQICDEVYKESETAFKSQWRERRMQWFRVKESEESWKAMVRDTEEESSNVAISLSDTWKLAVVGIAITIIELVVILRHKRYT